MYVLDNRGGLMSCLSTLKIRSKFLKLFLNRKPATIYNKAEGPQKSGEKIMKISKAKLRQIIKEEIRRVSEAGQMGLPGMPTHDLSALANALSWVEDIADGDLDRARDIGGETEEHAAFIQQKIDDGTIDELLSTAAGVKALDDAEILYPAVNVSPYGYQWEQVTEFDMTPEEAEDPGYVEIFYDDEFPAAKSLSAFLQAAAEAGVDPAEAHDALEGLDIDDLMARIQAFDSAAQGQGLQESRRRRRQSKLSKLRRRR